MRKTIFYFIRNGNLTGIAVVLALLMGFFVITASLYLFINQNFRIIGASIGLAIMAFGGYASRAKTLGLKPFDNSYKKAKESYKKEDKK
ncbi:hypothetical protein [Glaciimonas sp. PCH181]|uniref:hypothetical protein n=1 Tax=Glaciimonas sp. PCH181 TaxID=2133943 RepID=UPI000D3919DE|nr:hypothetical protein [Glaciimonas sp. PCH181]PUA18092.1 hypothetical protein C7W93_19905 [Glaciimonas sp. PCH181]